MMETVEFRLLGNNIDWKTFKSTLDAFEKAGWKIKISVYSESEGSYRFTICKKNDEEC